MYNIIITEPSSNLRRLGRNSLAGKWQSAIIATLIYQICITLPALILDQVFGKTLAELRNTPMFDQLISGDAEREERIGSLIELHLTAYRRRSCPDSESATETIPDTFSLSDIV